MDIKIFEPIVDYFENAYELAGAKNIVNAILVDFRGFDTMLEISVLNDCWFRCIYINKATINREGSK